MDKYGWQGKLEFPLEIKYQMNLDSPINNSDARRRNSLRRKILLLVQDFSWPY